MDTSDILVGKTIKTIDINGYGIELNCTDGTTLFYDASDGGCSLWEILGPGER